MEIVIQTIIQVIIFSTKFIITHTFTIKATKSTRIMHHKMKYFHINKGLCTNARLFFIYYFF